MFVDASAIVAIIAGEPEMGDLLGRLARARRCTTSAIAIYEAVLGLARISAQPASEIVPLVQRFLEHFDIEVVAIDSSIGLAALDAFARFGKGRHEAALNLGDCFSYACAQQAGGRLLFKGDDFTKTDLRAT